MKLGIIINAAEAQAEQRRTLSYTQAAILGGIVESTTGAKGALRDMTRGAFKGARMPNTWQSKVYGRTSFDPAGLIWSQAPEIMKAFSEGQLIKAANHRYLAVKTDLCPERGTDGKSIRFPSGTDAGNWPVDRYGPLRFVKRPGNTALLVVDGVRMGKSGRIKRLSVRKATKKMGERVNLLGQATAVMAVLVPQVKLDERINPEAALRPWFDQIPERIVERLKGGKE